MGIIYCVCVYVRVCAYVPFCSGLVPGQPSTIIGCQFSHHHCSKSTPTVTIHHHTSPPLLQLPLSPITPLPPLPSLQGPGFVSSAWGIFIFREIRVSSRLLSFSHTHLTLWCVCVCVCVWCMAGVEEYCTLFRCLSHFPEWTDYGWTIKTNCTL